jgi:3-oxoacyl-[acyl-carrier protein] reductase
VIDVNLKGTFFLCHFGVPHIPPNSSGRVITFSSELAYTGREELAHYCAAKAGIMGFTKSLARELGPAGITVNSVAPGPVDTAMLRANPKSYNESRRLEIPLQRWGTPEDIASTVTFLASDDASFYTGWVLSPNGGFVM